MVVVVVVVVLAGGCWWFPRESWWRRCGAAPPVHSMKSAIVGRPERLLPRGEINDLGEPRSDFPARRELFNPPRPPDEHQCTHSHGDIHRCRPTLPLDRMKTAVLLLAVLLAVTAALARPAEPEGAVARERRAAQEKKEDGRGSVTAGVHREDGVGTVVQAQGQGNVWTSKDGNSRVDAHGDWSKVVDGPGRGKPNYNVGIKFSSSF